MRTEKILDSFPSADGFVFLITSPHSPPIASTAVVDRPMHSEVALLPSTPKHTPYASLFYLKAFFKASEEYRRSRKQEEMKRSRQSTVYKGRELARR